MFIERLKGLRNEHKITQSALAEAMGLSQQAIAKWETGKSSPDINTLKKLADYFGVTTDFLTGYTPSLDTRPDLPPLTRRDERDIAKDIEKMLAELDTSAALGGSLTPDGEDMELLKSSLTQAMTLAKRVAKQKFTPKKYRKE
ncbi:MAG: helix-turn-helix domain-containing protein [Anaerovibrio sp.]